MLVLILMKMSSLECYVLTTARQYRHHQRRPTPPMHYSAIYSIYSNYHHHKADIGCRLIHIFYRHDFVEEDEF